jgi:signal transduction histidine kinase/ActR/RegA family two-component response regulator
MDGARPQSSSGSGASGSTLAQPLPAGAAPGSALRLRLILIVATVCAAVWLSTLFDTLRDREATLAMAERQHDNIAGALAEQAARSLQATDLILQQAALLDPASPSDPDKQSAIPDLLRRHMSGVPQVRNLFMFDPARHLMLSSAAPGSARPDFSDRSYYMVQRDRPEQGLFVSEPFVSRVTGEPTFVLSRRLPGDSFHGIVGAAVDIGFIQRFYQALDLGSGSTIEMLREDGMTLVNRERGGIVGRASVWQPLLAELGDAAAQHTRFDAAGLGVSRVSLRHVPGYPAVVVVARAEHDILEGWRAKAWKNVARTFVITALAAVLLIAFLRQMRRHERMTAQLHQSQKLEALGTLAGGIAHDFNNVLGAVLGYGELALQHSEPGAPQRHYIDNIIVAANRARELVARILAFSRPGLARARPVLLQQVLAEVHSLTCAALPPGVTVQLDVPDRSLVVAGDAAQLHQMLGNLLTNAVQAVAEGGRVAVTALSTDVDEPRDCTVGRLLRGRYVRVDIADSGPGMSLEQVGRIFDPFFTTKPLGTGTGLGLSLVHGIVLDHGAALDVRSELGAGSTFSVYLPVSDRQPAQEPVPAELPQGHGETVLIIDDEEALVRVAEEVLAALGYEPVGCVGAQQALRLFRASPERFEIVLTDAIMPEMSGTALLREMQRLRPDLPAILMSGYGGPDLHAEAQAAGALRVLTKPLTQSDLAHALADIAGLIGKGRTAATAGIADSPAHS